MTRPRSGARSATMGAMRTVRSLVAPGPRVLLRLLLLAGLFLLAGLLAPSPASAEVRDITLTKDGPVPVQLQVEPGDKVRIVNSDTAVHRLASDSGNWSWTSGPILPTDSFTVPDAVTAAGTYSYAGLEGYDVSGTVVVPAAAAERSPTPAASPSPRASSAASAKPSPSASSSPSPAGTAAPSPVSTGGTGTVDGPPPLTGGSFSGPVPSLGPAAPAPQVAPGPQLPGIAPEGGEVPLPDVSLQAQAPMVAGELESAPGEQAVVASGPLPRLDSPVGARRLGLPLALAALLVVGVASLQVRVLLAEAPQDTGSPAPAPVALPTSDAVPGPTGVLSR